MKPYCLGWVALLLSLSGAAFADNLTWGGTYVSVWPTCAGCTEYGTSPYSATNISVSPNQGMKIFCLDFNDEIAPPTNWTASIMTLNQANVAGTGPVLSVKGTCTVATTCNANNNPVVGQYAAQYGGDYNNLLAAAYNNHSIPHGTETSAPYVSGASAGVVPPFAFNSDNAGGGYSVNLAPSNVSNYSQAAYYRYLEAAWLFADTQAAQAALPSDTNTDIIAQVAAWELFVNYSNLSLLTSDIQKTTGAFVFNNYLTLSSGTYMTNPAVYKQSTASIGFQQAVDAALAAAQTAVITDGWGPGSYNYGSWSIVTATPDYVIDYGVPVQEFLTPNGVPDQGPPIPEPKAAFLLATAVGLTLWKVRQKRLA